MAALASVTFHNIMIEQREPMFLDNPDRPAAGIEWFQQPAERRWARFSGSRLYFTTCVVGCRCEIAM